MLIAVNNKLLYNFFSLGAVQAISSLIQLIVIPHVIDKIGVAEYGVIAVAQVVMFYLAVFTDYSFSQTATRDIALYKSDHVKVSKIFSGVFYARLVLCIIAAFLLLILLLLVGALRVHFFLYVMAFTFVIGQALLINWFFLGLEKMHLITIVTLIARVLFAILVFLFIRDRDDGILFLFFLGVGNVIAGLVSLVIAFRIYKLTLMNPGLPGIVQELKDGWQITVSHLSNCTCHYANIFILRFFASDLLVGYYAIAERIYFTIKQVFVVFSQSVYPAISQTVQKGKLQAIVFLKQTYSWFLVAVVTGCLVLFILSPQVLYLFMGNEYPHAVFFLRFFCIIAIIVCLNIPGTLIVLAMDQKMSYLKVYAVATVLNILLNILLARFYHATGTLIAILITELFITIGLTRALYRTDRINSNWVSEVPGNIGY